MGCAFLERQGREMAVFARIVLMGVTAMVPLVPAALGQSGSKTAKPVACRVTVTLSITSGVPSPEAEIRDSRQIEKLRELLQDLPRTVETEEESFGTYSIEAHGKGCGLPERFSVYHGTITYWVGSDLAHFRDEKGLEEFLGELDYKEIDIFPKARKRATPQPKQPHEEWLAQRIREAQAIKAGMSRAELLKVFREEGGLQLIPARRYVLRSCAYVKVDVEFEIAAGQPLPPDAQLKIVNISKPYLEFAIVD